MNVLIKVPTLGGRMTVIGSEHITGIREASKGEAHGGVVVSMSDGTQVHVVLPEESSEAAKADPLNWLQTQIASIVQNRIVSTEVSVALQAHRTVQQFEENRNAARAAQLMAAGGLNIKG